jgi:hypothetical protein
MGGGAPGILRLPPSREATCLDCISECGRELEVLWDQKLE